MQKGVYIEIHANWWKFLCQIKRKWVIHEISHIHFHLRKSFGRKNPKIRQNHLIFNTIGFLQILSFSFFKQLTREISKVFASELADFFIMGVVQCVEDEFEVKNAMVTFQPWKSRKPFYAMEKLRKKLKSQISIYYFPANKAFLFYKYVLGF